EVGTGSLSTTTLTFASRSRGVVVMETLLALEKATHYISLKAEPTNSLASNLQELHPFLLETVMTCEHYRPEA
ncbi:MAG: hypothetical protein ACKO63_01135, partial [Nodosilinea sp.]